MAGVNDILGSSSLPPYSNCKRFAPNTLTAGDNHNLHSCSGHGRSRMCIPHLPKEIIFNILLCLPAVIIYNFTRYVCREWYNIIMDPLFVDAHLRKSPRGILIQSDCGLHPAFYVEMVKNGVDITFLKFSQEHLRNEKDFKWFCEKEDRYFGKFKFPGKILASCNGLTLFRDEAITNMGCFSLHIANIVSKQCVNLPPSGLLDEELYHVRLAYAASSKAHKVVRCASTFTRNVCHILTLGIDKAWRKLDMSCLPPQPDISLYFHVTPKPSAGFVHWYHSGLVLSLDVETESFHVTFHPKKYGIGRYASGTDGYFCVLVALPGLILDLWYLKDVKRGEWTMLKIDLSAHRPVFEQRCFSLGYKYRPLGLFKGGELLLLEFTHPVKRGKSGCFLICNVRTGGINYFQLDFGEVRSSTLVFCPHVMSLVSSGWSW